MLGIGTRIQCLTDCMRCPVSTNMEMLSRYGINKFIDKVRLGDKLGEFKVRSDGSFTGTLELVSMALSPELLWQEEKGPAKSTDYRGASRNRKAKCGENEHAD